MFWNNRQKLFVHIGSEYAGDECESLALANLSHARAVGAGVEGDLILGCKQIGLWTPQVRPSEIVEKPEWVCDLRYAPLSRGRTYELFCEAMKDANLSCHAVLFRGTNPHKIAAALEHFDFVIIPSKRIKNTDKDLRRGILSYHNSRARYRLSPDIKDD